MQFPSDNSVYVLKCLSCIALNAKEKNPSLPVVCPILHMPCFTLQPDKIDECLDKHSLCKGEPREPMNSELMDKAMIQQMINQYKTLPAKYRNDIKY